MPTINRQKKCSILNPFTQSCGSKWTLVKLPAVLQNACKCMQTHIRIHTHTHIYYIPWPLSVRFLIPFTFFLVTQRRLSVLCQQDVRGPESIMQLRCEREQMEFRRGLLPGTAQFRHNQHVLPAAKGSGRRGAGTHHTGSLRVCGDKWVRFWGGGGMESKHNKLTVAFVSVKQIHRNMSSLLPHRSRTLRCPAGARATLPSLSAPPGRRPYFSFSHPYAHIIPHLWLPWRAIINWRSISRSARAPRGNWWLTRIAGEWTIKIGGWQERSNRFVLCQVERRRMA